MLLKECVKQAFGYNAEERIMNFLKEKELTDCSDDTLRWLGLFKKCELWRKKFLLWEASTYINGIHGWNLNIDVCEFRIPKELSELSREKQQEWTTYLYQITLLLVVRGMSIRERNTLAEAGRKYNNFSVVVDDYYINGDYVSLTQEQWQKEVADLLKKSWENYQKFLVKNITYHREMELNYPKFRSILEYIAQTTKNCDVVRMNEYGGDEAIWYFGKTQNCFYVMRILDSM